MKTLKEIQEQIDKIRKQTEHLTEEAETLCGKSKLDNKFEMAKLVVELGEKGREIKDKSHAMEDMRDYLRAYSDEIAGLPDEQFKIFRDIANFWLKQ